MLNALRHSRLLAALLVTASPAVLGTVLPAVHPCPVEAPWLAQKGAAGSHADHHQAAHHEMGGPGHEHETCHCIGASLSGAAMTPPKTGELSHQILTLFAPPHFPTRDSSLDLAPSAALLPPATAPPLA